MRSRIVSVLGVVAVGRAGVASTSGPAAFREQLIHIDVRSATAGAGAIFALPPLDAGAEIAA
jgi:hypothetical protein